MIVFFPSDCRVSVPSILVKLLLSIDRSKELEIARKVVDLTILYGQRRSDVIVGLDVSGNMANSNITGFFPYIEKIRTAGLKITSRYSLSSLHFKWLLPKFIISYSTHCGNIQRRRNWIHFALIAQPNWSWNFHKQPTFDWTAENIWNSSRYGISFLHELI